MSSLVTRPWAPVPWTSSRFTPSLAAMLRTSGLENLRSRSSTSASPLRSPGPARAAAGCAGWEPAGVSSAGRPARAAPRRWPRGRPRRRTLAGSGGAGAARLRGAVCLGCSGLGRSGLRPRRAAAAPALLARLADRGATTWLTGTVSPSLLRISSSVPDGRARDLGVDLVGRDLEQRLVALHLVADLHQPAGDGPLGDRLSHLGHHDFSSHKLSLPSLDQSVAGQLTHLGDELVHIGQVGLFERRAVGDRGVRAAEPVDRPVQPLEGVLARCAPPPRPPPSRWSAPR